MYSAIQVAEYFVRKGIENRKPLTSLHAMKLVYLAHGYYLAERGRPLIIEHVEAWRHGVVIPSVFAFYHDNGRSPIEQVSDLPMFTLTLDKGVNKILEEVYTEHKYMPTEALLNKTSRLDAAWDKAHKRLGWGSPIPTQWIKKHFEEMN